MDKTTYLQSRLCGWLDVSISTFLNPCLSLVNQTNSSYWNDTWKFFYGTTASYIGINYVEQLLWFCIRSRWCSPMDIIYFRHLPGVTFLPYRGFQNGHSEIMEIQEFKVCIMPCFTRALKPSVLCLGLQKCFASVIFCYRWTHWLVCK